MWKSARAIALTAGLGLAASTLLLGCSGEAPPAPEPDAAAPLHPAAQAARDAMENPAARGPGHVREKEAQANRPPVIRNLSIEPAGDDAAAWRAVVDADDPEGDTIELEFVWFVNGEATDSRGESFDPTPYGRGDRFHVEVTPSDAFNQGGKAATGKIEIANTAPAITSQPPAKMAGGFYRYRVEARDPEGDRPIRFELLQSPSGMRIDPYSGELEWRPAADQAGTHTVEIAVSDNRGGRSTQLFDLPISSPDA